MKLVGPKIGAPEFIATNAPPKPSPATTVPLSPVGVPNWLIQFSLWALASEEPPNVKRPARTATTGDAKHALDTYRSGEVLIGPCLVGGSVRARGTVV
jgi:hypothetical protein